MRFSSNNSDSDSNSDSNSNSNNNSPDQPQLNNKLYYVTTPIFYVNSCRIPPTPPPPLL